MLCMRLYALSVKLISHCFYFMNHYKKPIIYHLACIVDDQVFETIFDIRSDVSHLCHRHLIRRTLMSLSAVASTWKRCYLAVIFHYHSTNELQKNKRISKSMETTVDHVCRTYHLRYVNLIGKREMNV